MWKLRFSLDFRQQIYTFLLFFVFIALAFLPFFVILHPFSR